MFTSADELLAYVKDEGVEIIDVRFCDLPGIMQHFTVPVGSFGPEVFEDGLAFDGSSIRGFQKIHESDMALLPDPTTAYLDPFRIAKTLCINFFVHDPLTKEPYSRDPRNIARKAENYLASTGIGDTAFFAPEAEFYVFDDVRFETKQNTGYYSIDSVAGAWNTGRVEDGGNRGYKVRYKGGYFPVPPVDHFSDLRDEMTKNLEASGLIVERAHHEVGTAGQAEINYRFNTMLSAGDDLQKFKYIIKNTAWAAGKTATFMPKPIFGDNGSGMHVHSSIWNDGTPLFYDEAGYGGLSDVARWYIGGMLEHAPSMLAFTNPTRELLPPPGAGLRGAGQPGLQLAQPLGRDADPDHRLQPEGQAGRVPLPGPVVQPVPGLRGAAAGRYRRDPEQDRAGGPGRQGPLRAAAGGARLGADRAGQPGRGAGHAGGRPRLPAGRRRLHPRPDRDLGRAEAGRHRLRPAAPAPARVRALLRLLARNDR